MSAVQRLLAGALLNAEVRGEAIPTLPFVISSVSTTPEREGGDHTDSVAGTNLRTINAPQRFVISSDSSHHSGDNIAEAEVDSLVRSSVPIMTVVTTVTSTVDPASTAKEKTAAPSLFVAGSSSSGGTEPITGGFSDLTGSDFLVGGIHTVIDPDTDIQKVYVFASIRRMEHDQLFTKFNVRAARQMSLSAEYNIREKRRLKSVVEERAELLKVRSEDQVVLGETTLSFALSVSHSRVERIRANIATEQSALLGVWTPFSIPPITVDDYEIVHANSQESSQGNVQGDTATVEFEKEDLDTTPEHDLLN
ncbi:hypothetical protein Tco_0678882 [Tanacetum coccineum]|uniref:Uncharacterized protein n=1 Tax=Tanacetum coccineum TaxID=301880 RepID=A0ABQ4XGA4_9ASTR